MKNFWDMTVKFMNNIWDKTIELLGRLNAWIPLSAVLLAGLGLVAVVLILAICGCVLRKRLVPHWLIWTYFTFAVIIIFAHTGNDLAAVVAALEIPVLIVLICYVLYLLFRRRPRYTYVETNVYARQLAKGQVYRVAADGETIVEEKPAKKEKKAKKNKKESKDAGANEIEFNLAEEQESAKEEDNIVVVDHVDEMRAVEKAEAEKVAAAEKAAREAREKEKEQERKIAEMSARETVRPSVTPVAKEEPVRRVDKTDFLTARTVRPNLTSSTATTNVDLPTVNPIPDKTYEPMREPTIVTKPISQTIPGLKMTGSSNTTSRYSSSFSRPTTTTTSRPSSFGSTRPTTTTSSTNNTFSSMYNPRIVKTTTTTVNTTPSSTTSSSFNRSASSSATTVKSGSTTTTANTHSTEDIMAAIERLRNSMKK